VLCSPSSISAENKKIKILLYHCDHNPWIYTTALQLKTYIDLRYPATAEKLEWLIPLQNEINDEELLQHIKQNKVDILCTSHYLWNHNQLTNQLSRIKDRLHHQTVIAGGPSIDVNVNQKFFQQHPYIDYAVYGAGEQAFADIINHLVLGSPLIAFNTSNCAWQNYNTGKTVVADYKFVKMLETSPFLHNETMFVNMIKSSQHTAPWLSYTLTRGCPYSCTFCDWNSGLGNKVSRRKNTYQQEIDLFQRAGITNIYLADANVGQYDEDVDMIEYFAEKNLKENTGFHVGGNFSKLKKENNLKIFHIMARGKLVNKTLNFSIQDTNQQVLQNINRPDVGWDTHVSMADELRDAYPDLVVKAQLIYGLPGQTVTTWRQTLGMLASKNIWPMIFLNEPLPASPAVYDEEYQKKFQYQYIISTRYLSKPYQSLLPTQSVFFNQADIVRMNLLNAIYIALITVNITAAEANMAPIDVESSVDKFLQLPQYQNLFDNLYHNWTQDNNFYYTQDFSGVPSITADIYLYQRLLGDENFLIWLGKTMSKDVPKEYWRLVKMKKFAAMANTINMDVD
jgi:tRNA A37 methylthiotransferase MiaB